MKTTEIDVFTGGEFGEEEYYIDSRPGTILRRCDLSIAETPQSDNEKLNWEITEMNLSICCVSMACLVGFNNLRIQSSKW